MSTTSEQIIQQALTLPIEERAELIERLLEMFEGATDPALDKLWAREAHDRLDAYDRGELKAVDIEDMLE